MKNVIKRDPEIVLPLSLRFASEYFDALCRMQEDIKSVQESKKLTTIHRALWTALIIEVGRLFDSYDAKDTISFSNFRTTIVCMSMYIAILLFPKFFVSGNT